MDIENVIALAAILTTGAVAFTGQLFSHWREAATQQHTERLQTDAEARSVLDGALATAYEARAALGDYATVLLARLYKSTPATPCSTRSSARCRTSKSSPTLRSAS